MIEQASRCVWLAVVLIACSATMGRAEVVTWPAPQGEPLSEDYTVEVDGKAVPAYPVQTHFGDKE